MCKLDENAERGVLLVFSGPSGAGKGTALNIALDKNTNLRPSVSCTTRAPRPGEIEGEAYYFKTVQQFKDMVVAGEFLEYKEVYGNYYGTPKKQVFDMLNEGYDVVLEIDVQGAFEVKKNVPDSVLVFFTPGSHAETERRLRGRGTEPDDIIKKRLDKAKGEIKQAKNYNYIIVSTTPEQSAEKFLTIIGAERQRALRQLKAIQKYSD